MSETPVTQQKPDAWHTHGAEEGAPQIEHGSHVSPTALAVTLVGMVLGVVFVILILVVYFNSYVSNQRAEKLEGVGMGAEYRATHAENLARLSGYGWADAETGTVHVPIEVAMDAVVENYSTP